MSDADFVEAFDLDDELWLVEPGKALTKMVRQLFQAHDLLAEAKAELEQFSLEHETWIAQEKISLLGKDSKIASWKADAYVAGHGVYHKQELQLIRLRHRLGRVKGLVSTLETKMRLMSRYMETDYEAQ